jgi:hypothetical protein
MNECDRNLTVRPDFHVIFTGRTLVHKVVSPQVLYPKRQMDID